MGKLVDACTRPGAAPRETEGTRRSEAGAVGASRRSASARTVADRVRRRHRVERDDAGLRISTSPAPHISGVPDGLRGDPALDQVDGQVRCDFLGAFAQDGEHLARSRRNRAGPSASPHESGREAPDCEATGDRRGRRRAGVAALARQDRVGQRAEHRLAVLPADRVERAPRVGDVDRLVADGAEVARGVAREDLEDLVGLTCRASPAAAASADDSSQLSMAVVNARTACACAGTDFVFTARIVQSPSRASSACDSLKWSTAQRRGSQRSFRAKPGRPGERSGPRAPRGT